MKKICGGYKLVAEEVKGLKVEEREREIQIGKGDFIEDSLGRLRESIGKDSKICCEL